MALYDPNSARIQKELVKMLSKLLTYKQKECIFVFNGGANMEAYCVKCRTKKEMKAPKAITMKNKRPATTGTCPTCGTKMFKIGKAK